MDVAAGIRMRLFVVWVFLAAGLQAEPPRHGGLVDAHDRAFVIDHILETLQKSYVHEEMAQQMAAEVRAHQSAGDYDRFTDAAQFVRALTRDLQVISRDRHLLVDFSPEPVDATVPSRAPEMPVDPRPPSDADDAGDANTRRSRHCQFVNVAVLAGNIGYLKVDALLSPDLCAEKAAAAMSLVADCDALLIDLRDNAGGDPVMVAFLSSYLFTKPVHLTDLYERRTNLTVESWTLPFVPGRKFIGKPVFVITSPRTFSGAEEFAYDLQLLKRAVIVGERSGGGAHPVRTLRIGTRFQVEVPVAQYINPLSRTNWEGTGVEPDIRAREPVAVQAAYRAALQDVRQRLTSPEQRKALQDQIDKLTNVISAQQ